MLIANNLAIAAKSVAVNVYLKLKSQNHVSALIEEFNQFLLQSPELNPYHLKPLLAHYPLHVTLYLASYEKAQLHKIMKQIKDLAKQQKMVSLISNTFDVNKGGYVMLSIKPNTELTQLSNHVLNRLVDLHDKNAPIPLWAATDLKRITLFKAWGSPNVLNYFNPHFSVLAPIMSQADIKQNLEYRLRMLTQQFNATQQTQVKTQALAIGIGLANSQGQIIKELATYNLQ